MNLLACLLLAACLSANSAPRAEARLSRLVASAAPTSELLRFAGDHFGERPGLLAARALIARAEGEPAGHPAATAASAVLPLLREHATDPLLARLVRDLDRGVEAEGIDELLISLASDARLPPGTRAWVDLVHARRVLRHPGEGGAESRRAAFHTLQTLEAGAQDFRARSLVEDPDRPGVVCLGSPGGPSVADFAWAFLRNERQAGRH